MPLFNRVSPKGLTVTGTAQKNDAGEPMSSDADDSMVPPWLLGARHVHRGLLRAIAAGAALSTWVVLWTPIHVTVASSVSDWAAHLCAAAMLTIVITLLGALLGPGCLVGCGLPSHASSCSSLPTLLAVTAQVIVGNTSGAILGASTAAFAVRRLADRDCAWAGEAMSAALDAAVTLTNDWPPLVFVTAVAAGALMTTALQSFPSAAAARFLVVFGAATVTVGLQLHLGVIDKSVVSAVAAINVMDPVVKPLGPHLFIYGISLVGNGLGAVVACALVDLTATLFIELSSRQPTAEVPTKGVMLQV